MSFKPRPILQDMPYHVKQRIARKLELYTDKIALRAFSTDFSHIIRNPEARISTLKFFYDEEYNLTLKIGQGQEKLSLEYEEIDESSCEVKNKSSGNSYRVSDSDRTKVAISHFQQFLDNPNLTIETFKLSVSSSTDHLFLQSLFSSIKTLKVESLFLFYSGRQESALEVLSHLDSKVLKDAFLFVSFDDDCEGPEYSDVKVDELVKLEQWKNLQELSLCSILSSLIPMEHYWNVPELTLRMFSENGSCLGELQVLVEHFRQSATFRECKIEFNFEEEDVCEAVGEDNWMDVDGVMHLMDYEFGVAVRVDTIYINAESQLDELI